MRILAILFITIITSILVLITLSAHWDERGELPLKQCALPNAKIKCTDNDVPLQNDSLQSLSTPQKASSHLPLIAQHQLRERLKQWKKMSPEKRRIARENYQILKMLPSSKRVAAWHTYQTLSLKQKDDEKQ